MLTCMLHAMSPAQANVRGSENPPNGCTRPSCARTRWMANAPGEVPAILPTRPQSCARRPQTPDTGMNSTCYVETLHPSPFAATDSPFPRPRRLRPLWLACARDTSGSASAGHLNFVRIRRKASLSWIPRSRPRRRPAPRPRPPLQPSQVRTESFFVPRRWRVLAAFCR